MKLEDFFWSCPYRTYLGIECYGCGAQTALALLWKGEFAESFRTYPALPTLPLLGLVFLLFVITKKRKLQNLLLPLVILNVVLVLGSYYLI